MDIRGAVLQLAAKSAEHLTLVHRFDGIHHLPVNSPGVVRLLVNHPQPTISVDVRFAAVDRRDGVRKREARYRPVPGKLNFVANPVRQLFDRA